MSVPILTIDRTDIKQTNRILLTYLDLFVSISIGTGIADRGWLGIDSEQKFEISSNPTLLLVA